MDLLKIGAQLLAQKLGSKLGSNALQGILGNLIGDGDSLNIASLVSKMQGSGGLGDIVQSWLGDGDNAEISVTQLNEVIDSDRLQQTANELGTDQFTLMETLAQVVPQMVDNGSKGGSLLDSIGGLGGAASLAKNLFR